MASIKCKIMPQETYKYKIFSQETYKCRITSQETYKYKIISQGAYKIKLKQELFRVKLIGAGIGTIDHSKALNLDYENSGHTGFQKEITWDDAYRSFLIDKN